MTPLTILFAAALVTSPPPPAPGCTDEAHRQFDFWIGDWEVRGGADGETLLGHNRIASEAGGCVLHEHWRGARGLSGMSLNTYDPARRRWLQFWVGGDGVILRLEGGIEDGAMVMQGELPAAGGGVQRQRIRWTPLADGSVEQRWETSENGRQWSVAFLGHYRRR